MKITKNYLTAEEVISIANEMKSLDSYVGREATKWVMIASLCTDFAVEKDEAGLIVVDLATYDKLYTQNVLPMLMADIYNHDQVDKQYESLVDVKHSAYKLIEKLSEKIETVDMSKLDIKSMLNSVKNIVGDKK